MFRVSFRLDLDPACDNRIVYSDLRHRIKESPEQAGIVIPHPQADVHLESKGPIEARVVPAADAEASGR